MTYLIVPAALAFVALVSSATAAEKSAVNWVPSGIPAAPSNGPALCPGAYLTPEQGKAVLDAAAAKFPDRQSWDAYAAHLRTRIQEGAGLAPWPKRTPLNPIIGNRRAYDGYTVENVAFESVPGYFVTGNLYKPATLRSPHAAIIATHGHTRRIEKPEDYDSHGRFSPSMQARCANLARMGAVVISLDMVGCGDSIQLVGQDAHRRPFSLTLQLWNALRAVDFLFESQKGVDRNRIGVTGESGGGTQAFLLTALEPRITFSVPVVMVSAHFFGGCPCESGMPIHRSADHFANNVMIAALAAPRPMLVISDGKDWTLNVPNVELPFLQRIYGYYGAERNVGNVHLAEEGHDYGPSKRAALNRFLSERFGMDLTPAQQDGKPDESRVTIETAGPMHVFSETNSPPAHALRDIAAVERALRDLQK